MIDLKILLLVFGGFMYLYCSTINPKDSRVSVEAIYYNVTLKDASEFIINPDSFDKWFRWISYVYPADHKRIGRGKKYIVVFVRAPIIFETKILTAEENTFQMLLEGNAVLRPAFEIKVEQMCSHEHHPRVKIHLSLTFQRYSMLFHLFMGKILKSVSKERMLEALSNLEYTLQRFEMFKAYKML